MATADIAQQLVEAAQKDPNLISQLTSDPASVVKSITGLDLSDKELTEVVTCATKLAKGEQVDMGTVASLAADLFSQHGGDLTKIMGSLLGGGDDDGSAEEKKTTKTSKTKSSKKSTAKEDSDSSEGGINLGEVASIAETLFGGK